MPASNIEGTLHVDRYLTNFSVQYVQDAGTFVSHVAASVIPVTKQSDKYVVYDRGYFWRDEAEPRPLGGRPAQVTYKVGEGTYSAVEYALEHVVDDRQRANVDDPIRLDQLATTLLTQKQMIKQDRVWATELFKASAGWSHLYVGTASTPGANQFLQFDDANSDPIGVIDEARDLVHERTGFMPNTLVLGSDVKRTLRTHPDVADRIKYVQHGIADDSILAALLEVDKVMVARSIYNSANEGATDNFEYIVDKKGMFLGYIDPNPGLDSPTAIAKFVWTGLMGGAANNIGGVMARGRDDRASSDYFQNHMAWDIRQVAPDLGFFFQSTVV
jgi:hypothetical protein